MHICSEEINAFLAFLTQLTPGWTYIRAWLRSPRDRSIRSGEVV